MDFAVQEAVYALDALKADGIGLLASSGGQPLADPDLKGLMAKRKNSGGPMQALCVAQARATPLISIAVDSRLKYLDGDLFGRENQ